MSAQRDTRFKSRLFPSKSTDGNAGGDSSSRSRVHGQDRRGAYREPLDIPQDSVYNDELWQSSGKKDQTYKTSWITVIGVVRDQIQEVRDFFSKYGPIMKVNDHPGNWIYIEYAAAEMAEKAVAECSQSPVLVTGTLAVSCVMGRLRPDYVADDDY